MKRRGVLGLIAGALAAGPSVAKQAVGATVADLSVPGVALSPVAKSDAEARASNSLAFEWGKPDPHKTIARLNGDLENLLRLTNEGRSRRLNRIEVRALDPDIACSQSFSLDAKFRMQRERQLRRNLASEKAYLLKRIAELTAEIVTP